MISTLRKLKFSSRVNEDSSKLRPTTSSQGPSVRDVIVDHEQLAHNLLMPWSSEALINRHSLHS